MKLVSTLLALAACAALAGPAQAVTYTWTGDTTNSPKWDRPQGDFGGLSSFGYSTPYDVLQFSVSQSGEYVFLSTTTSLSYANTLWDNYTFLYQDSFSPTLPGVLNNIVNANDDNPTRFESGFTQDLTAGTTYYFITTGVHRAMFGSYVDSISGPGSIAAVPEPATAALSALGLAAVGLCARRRRA